MFYTCPKQQQQQQQQKKCRGKKDQNFVTLSNLKSKCWYKYVCIWWSIYVCRNNISIWYSASQNWWRVGPNLAILILIGCFAEIKFSKSFWSGFGSKLFH